MDVFDAIIQRRSIKPTCMKPDAVDGALVRQLLEAANWAPSHRHTEPWRFVVLTGDARRELANVVVRALPTEDGSIAGPDHPKFASTYAKMLTPPVIIAIICAPSSMPKVIEHEEIASTAIAVQNMHLAARALGLGGFWSSGSKAFHPNVASFLGIESPARCLGFFYVGWPNIEWPTGKRGPVDDKVTWRA